MDDPTDRQRLADSLTEALWEAEWRIENDATTENLGRDFNDRFEDLGFYVEP
jgi:hypothetical protein